MILSEPTNLFVLPNGEQLQSPPIDWRKNEKIWEALTNPDKRVICGVFGAIAKPAEPLWYSLDRCKTWHQGDMDKSLELVPNHSTGNDADREVVLWTAFTRGRIN